jgi:hypothetical protein
LLTVRSKMFFVDLINHENIKVLLASYLTRADQKKAKLTKALLIRIFSYNRFKDFLTS